MTEWFEFPQIIYLPRCYVDQSAYLSTYISIKSIWCLFYQRQINVKCKNKDLNNLNSLWKNNLWMGRSTRFIRLNINVLIFTTKKIRSGCWLRPIILSRELVFHCETSYNLKMHRFQLTDLKHHSLVKGKTVIAANKLTNIVVKSERLISN